MCTKIREREREAIGGFQYIFLLLFFSAVHLPSSIFMVNGTDKSDFFLIRKYCHEHVEKLAKRATSMPNPTGAVPPPYT